ncbi:uncharacterized protein BDR25DRAFT_355826 [Lindgomyces ingoldianus]|uniref:Uncharacterized protein n=1 Tax=Lindgomyces ingoldianus TaxID=673940 RepID=A0ACB6QT59_9PLEO|nr:uncharacterized protein BDR25DRAFT_355826 [Lindgomyces ingoldianus]KAF2470116.1 hypothetical protein BDR25DRAFT_355826 [Lindgomyces ingoldianus]
MSGACVVWACTPLSKPQTRPFDNHLVISLFQYSTSTTKPKASTRSLITVIHPKSSLTHSSMVGGRGSIESHPLEKPNTDVTPLGMPYQGDLGIRDVNNPNTTNNLDIQTITHENLTPDRDIKVYENFPIISSDDELYEKVWGQYESYGMYNCCNATNRLWNLILQSTQSILFTIIKYIFQLTTAFMSLRVVPMAFMILVDDCPLREYLRSFGEEQVFLITTQTSFISFNIDLSSIGNYRSLDFHEFVLRSLSARESRIYHDRIPTLYCIIFQFRLTSLPASFHSCLFLHNLSSFEIARATSTGIAT